MVRKQIYIEPRQEAMLKRLVGEGGITEAELIRQAIDQWATGAFFLSHNLGAWERECEFIHNLIRQGSVVGGRSWRREDLYEGESPGR